MFYIMGRADMGTFPTRREALYWVAWLTRTTGTRHAIGVSA